MAENKCCCCELDAEKVKELQRIIEEHKEQEGALHSSVEHDSLPLVTLHCLLVLISLLLEYIFHLFKYISLLFLSFGISKTQSSNLYAFLLTNNIFSLAFDVSPNP